MFLFTISGEIPSLMRICCSLFAFLSLSTSECYVTEIRWIYEKFGAAGNWKNLRPCVCLFAVASSAFNSATMRLMLANKRSINKLYVPENAPRHRYTAAHLAMERNLISDPKIDFHGNFWLVFRFRFRDWFGANPLADIKVTCRVSLQFVRYFPLSVYFPPENLLAPPSVHELCKLYRIIVSCLMNILSCLRRRHTCRNSIERDWKSFATRRNLFCDRNENAQSFPSLLGSFNGVAAALSLIAEPKSD